MRYRPPIFEHLRALRADVSTVKTEVRELTHRVGRIELGIVGIRHDLAQTHEATAELGVRVDNLVERVERIERRLDLAE